MEKQRERILRSVERVGRQFTKPDEDWVPVLLLETAKGGQIVPLQTDDKQALPRMIAQLFEQFRPTFAALVLSAWERTIEPAEPLGDLTIELAREFGVSTDPKRQEIVLVEVCDGERTEYWSAPILRHADQPPTLGPWEDRSSLEHQGRLAGVLQRAFDQMKN